jgi:haloalkane dehalogenase
LYPFEPRRFDTGRGAMSYLDEGAGDEALVLVHGNPTWSFYYREVVRAFRGRLRCIAPDHLGCGLSDKPAGFSYTLGEHVRNLRALLDRLQLRRVHLVVHDWGGPIGLGAALARPEQLGRVVLLNTAAFADRRIPARIRLCRTPRFGEWLVRRCNGFAWPATRMAVVRPLPSDVRRGYLYPYDSWEHRIAVHRFVADIPRGRGGPSDAALADIERRLPVLRDRAVRILWGGRDFCFDRHYYNRWRVILPGANADYLDDAGHYVLEDARDFCLREITAHLGI